MRKKERDGKTREPCSNKTDGEARECALIALCMCTGGTCKAPRVQTCNVHVYLYTRVRLLVCHTKRARKRKRESNTSPIRPRQESYL